jgi:hypothetical protein
VALTGVAVPNLSQLRPPALAVQLGAVGVALAVVAFAPAAAGPMLLVPAAGSTGAAASLAIANGARLVAAGPLPGSVIVWGERSALLPAMLGAGILVVTADPATCGARRRLT